MNRAVKVAMAVATAGCIAYIIYRAMRARGSSAIPVARSRPSVANPAGSGSTPTPSMTPTPHEGSTVPSPIGGGSAHRYIHIMGEFY